MPLFVSAQLQHVAELNKLNDAIATVADLQFGVPEDTTAEEKAAKSNKDTKVELTGVGAKYHGKKTVYYNRQHLSTPFANQSILLELIAPVTSLYQQLDDINSQLATTFSQDDLEDVDLTNAETTGVLKLTAKAGSYGWKGDVSLGYAITDPYLIQIPDVNLDGVMTPNDSTLLEQAALRYSYWDFHLNRAFIDTLVAGPLKPADVTALIAIFNDIDTTAWVATGEANYSLDGAQILYNGTAGEWATSRLFKNVLVIQLSAKSTLLTGNLYLHYNDPAEA